MYLGNTADQVASGVVYIHPALTEVVEQALLSLLFRGSPGRVAGPPARRRGPCIAAAAIT
jgi:hypothetical protein